MCKMLFNFTALVARRTWVGGEDLYHQTHLDVLAVKNGLTARYGFLLNAFSQQYTFQTPCHLKRGTHKTSNDISSNSPWR